MITKEQQQVLIGGLLGDFCLFTQKKAINPLLSITRSIKDEEYLKHHFSIFEEFCLQGITYSTKKIQGYDKEYGLCKFRTRGLPVFKPYSDIWYPSGKKIVPLDINLTPLILATWFCDDGCITIKKDRKGNNSNARRIKFATHGFSKTEVEFLSNLLEKTLLCKFHIGNDKNRYFIHSCTEAANSVYRYIKDVIPLSMNRKIKNMENYVE